MARPWWSGLAGFLLPVPSEAAAYAQKPSTWEKVREIFRVNNSNLRAYRETCLKIAAEDRDTVPFACPRSGASLLDFLDAQKSYRDMELSDRNLIVSYLSAANQLNVSVGREVIR